MPLIKTADLRREFAGRKGLFRTPPVAAVRGVDLEIFAGKTLGLVGESGCGKSTVGRMCVGLLPPTAGQVFVRNEPLYRETPRGPRLPAEYPGGMQMIFQDPHSSLNPRMRVGESVGEALICRGAPAGERLAAVEEMFSLVGLGPEQTRRYPHEFSGGQRQRLAIARALITRPFFVVCDEPTSSLDASVQAQVLNLLKDVQERFGPAYLFISHDLAVVRHMSDVVAVMYAGLVVEQGGAEDLFARPLHPYTRLLLEAVPDTRAPEAESAGKATSAGPDSGRFAQGCPFAPRCPEAGGLCREAVPPLRLLPAAPGREARWIRCHTSLL